MNTVHVQYELTYVLSVIFPILKWSEKVLRTGGQLFLEVDPCHPYLLPDKMNNLKQSHKNFRLELTTVLQDYAKRDRFVIFTKI